MQHGGGSAQPGSTRLVVGVKPTLDGEGEGGESRSRSHAVLCAAAAAMLCRPSVSRGAAGAGRASLVPRPWQSIGRSRTRDPMAVPTPSYSLSLCPKPPRGCLRVSRDPRRARAAAWLEQAGGGRRALELIGKAVGGRALRGTAPRAAWEWGARGRRFASRHRALRQRPGAAGPGERAERQGRVRGGRDRNRCGNGVREGGGTF